MPKLVRLPEVKSNTGILLLRGDHSSPGSLEECSECNHYVLWARGFNVGYQQKEFPSRHNGSTRWEALYERHHTHRGGWLHLARGTLNMSRSIVPTDRCFTFSSRFVSLLLWTLNQGLWPTVPIRQNGIIEYVRASGLQWDGWSSQYHSLHSFYPSSKCNSLFTKYTHHFMWPDLCGYGQSIARSVHLLPYS